MTALLVYENSISNANRKNGMIALGSRIKKKVVIGGESYLDAVFNSIEEVMSHSSPSYICTCSFIYKGSPENLKIVKIKKRAKKSKIICKLEQFSGVNPVFVIKILEEEAKEEEFGLRRLHMNAVFPDKDDVGGFAYLTKAGQDILDTGDANIATDYLMAFKFLTRCS